MPKNTSDGLNLRAILAGCVVLLLLVGGYYWWHTRPAPHAETEVFTGVHYTALDMDAEGYHGEGLAHIARIDLSAPGVEFFVTPLDATAQRHGKQYRLRYTWQMAWHEDLAVAVNGALFQPPSYGYWPYAMADGHHTAISDGVVSHVNPASYLLWFEEDLTPHLTAERPVPAEVLAHAQWGIGGLVRELRDGTVLGRASRGTPMNRYTMIAVNPEAMMLWLASFEQTTRGTAAQILADRGAQDGLVLDGGGSTAFYLSRQAQGAPGGLLLGGARPVATHIGVRAKPLDR